MEFIAIAIVVFAVITLQNYIFKKLAFTNLVYSCYFDVTEAVEGDTIYLVEELRNNGWFPLPWLKSEITTSKWLDFAGTQSIVTDNTRFVPSFFMVKSYQKITRRWKVSCLKRGEFSIEKVVLVSCDLLGNVSLSTPVAVTASVVVFPAPFKKEELTVSPRYFYGEIVVKRHLLEDPFIKSGVREYTERDGVNKIHWAATAKEQSLMVYNNDYTSSQTATIILNMQSMEVERFNVIDEPLIENCIRVCAGIFDNTLKTGMPIRFMANGNTNGGKQHTFTPLYWGKAFITDLFYTLSRLKLTATRDFTHYLGEISALVTTTDVVIVTAYINESILQFANSKGRQGVNVTILCLGSINEGIDRQTKCRVVNLKQYFVKGDDHESFTA